MCTGIYCVLYYLYCVFYYFVYVGKLNCSNNNNNNDDDDDNNNNNNNRNTAHVECKNKGDTSNNRGNWDYFKDI